MSGVRYSCRLSHFVPVNGLFTPATVQVNYTEFDIEFFFILQAMMDSQSLRNHDIVV